MSLFDKERIIKLKRVSYDSLDNFKFVSDEKKGFVITMIINKTEPTVNISVFTDIVNAGSVKNVCDSIFWFNGFAKGEIIMYDQRMNSIIRHISRHMTMKVCSSGINYWSLKKYLM